MLFGFTAAEGFALLVLVITFFLGYLTALARGRSSPGSVELHRPKFVRVDKTIISNKGWRLSFWKWKEV
jgi:hypothetical protein